jgi:hypothetical protein
MTVEYLDRSSLVARMKYYENHTAEESGEHYAYAVALREIRNAPAADVAEVVRCKDCEYVRPTINVHTGEQAGIWCALHDILNVSPDDYCSRGEKKGGRPCD